MADRYGIPDPPPEWEANNPGYEDVHPGDERWGPDPKDDDGNLGGEKAEGAQAQESLITLASLPTDPPAGIPPRPWAYGNFLLFGQAAALGAVDGGGKGSMAVAIALSMITGRDLLGERPWRTGPVAIVTYEDDADEWRRRIAAACMHYDINYAAAVRQFHFVCRTRGKIVFGRDATGAAGDEDGIIAALTRIKAALLIVDPFNHAHAATDGNSNVEIARVAGEMTRVAREAQVAVLVLHHLRKGSTGAADDLMGATSLRATFRSSRILARMTDEEARKLDIKLDAWRYSRIAGSKENYAPPPGRATWFKLDSVSLGNGTEAYPNGDNVQVTTTWQPPGIVEGMEPSHMAEIFATIRAGLPDGELYSPRRQAVAWVGKVIMSICGKGDEAAAAIVTKWIKEGVLTVEKAKDKNRNEVDKVRLNESKAAAMTPRMGGGDED